MRTPRIVTLVLVALLAPLGLLLGASPAYAHDRLISTTPTDGASVAAPSSVQLAFSDTVLSAGTQVAVKGPHGAVAGHTAISGSSVTTTFDTSLDPGAYTVAWRATSSDGHPISGSFGFTVTGGSSSSAAPQTSSAASSATTSSAAASSSSSPAAPAKQTPTDDTNNAARWIIPLALLALALIGGGAWLARRRTTGDEPVRTTGGARRGGGGNGSTRV